VLIRAPTIVGASRLRVKFGCRREYLFCNCFLIKVKVKRTFVQALGLCTGHTAHRGVEV